jgi:hypothetical protein
MWVYLHAESIIVPSLGRFNEEVAQICLDQITLLQLDPCFPA